MLSTGYARFWKDVKNILQSRRMRIALSFEKRNCKNLFELKNKPASSASDDGTESAPPISYVLAVWQFDKLATECSRAILSAKECFPRLFFEKTLEIRYFRSINFKHWLIYEENL